MKRTWAFLVSLVAFVIWAAPPSASASRPSTTHGSRGDSPSRRSEPKPARFTAADVGELRVTIAELRRTARSCKGTVMDDEKAEPLFARAAALESLADRIARAALRSPRIEDER